MKKDETFLVTGATGFVGSAITHRLVNLGKNVHIISRSANGNWRTNDINKQIHIHKLDLTDPKLFELLEKIKPNYVLHLASYGSLPSEDNAFEMIKVNVLGTINLINSLSKKNLKLFINTGSSAEYKIKDSAINENDTLLPMNDYAVSKAAQTLFCQKEALTQNLPIITFRLFSPYGARETGTRLIPHVILEAMKNADISLSSPTFVRDFVYVEDVVDAYLAAIKKIPNNGEIFNIAGGKDFSIEKIVKEILSITKSNSKIKWDEIKKQIRQVEPNVWRADIKKAEKILGWKPKHSLNAGLVQTINWFKKNQNLYANAKKSINK